MEHLYQQDAFELVLGWEFYVPLLIALVLIVLAVPVWAVLGVTSILMLHFSGVLPLSLLGEALFDGIDAFALIAVPLFILTGDVLVRTGLSHKLLDVAEALVGVFARDSVPRQCWYAAFSRAFRAQTPRVLRASAA